MGCIDKLCAMIQFELGMDGESVREYINGYFLKYFLFINILKIIFFLF